LAQVLRHVPVATDPRILVDASTKDDAAVIAMAPDRAVVATVDFFTPIVDDPYDFGRIAAANAFSDVYAMGATPLVALNLVGWPRDTLPFELLGEIVRGGADVARQAGAFVVGGHSVDDREPKYGMVVIGEVRPDRIVRNSGARPGDALVLTKPIGTGVLTTALKRDLLAESDLAPAVATMTTLNAGAARAMSAVAEGEGGGIHAATDVTGFGLLGHLRSMLEASGAAGEVTARAVPILPRTREAAERGAVPGGTERNLASLTDAVTFAAGIDQIDRTLLADAQTSGGLLISVARDRADALVAALQRERTPAAAVIGRVIAGTPGRVTVV
jgi:selenide, water dikinase